MATQLQLNTKGYLDVAENTPVPITYSVAPISDITIRQGTFSKTIRLPGTKNNNALMGYLFGVNIVNSSFDVRHKEACSVINNGVTQFVGFLQLIDIVKQSPTSPSGDEQIYYDVSIKDDAGDFFSSLNDDDFIETLGDFSALTATLSFANILASYNNTWRDKYKWYMTYHNRKAYTLQDFGMAISDKAIWDSIWKETGFSYDWPTLSGTGFDRCYTPYNGDIPIRRQDQTNALAFKASWSGSVYDINLGSLGPNNVFPAITLGCIDVVYAPAYTEFDVYGTPTGPGGCANPLYNPVPNDTSFLPMNIIWNDNTTTGTTGSLFDTGNQYDVSTGVYTSNKAGFCTFNIGFNSDIVLRNNDPTYPIRLPLASDSGPLQYFINDTSVSFTVYVELKVTHPGGSQFTANKTELFTFDEATSKTTVLNPGDNVFSADTFFQSTLIELFPSSQVQACVRYDFHIPNHSQYAWVNNTLPNHRLIARPDIIIRMNIDSPVDYTLNFFSNTPSNGIYDGTTLYIADFIPKKIKRKDFITSIVRMFNLYISATDNDKILKIESRDEFYDTGGTNNWSEPGKHKLIQDKDQTLKLLPTLQDKKILFTYKDDTNDDLLQKYKYVTGEIYGQLEYTFNTDYTTSTKTLDVIFSPTILTTNYFNLVVPAIDGRSPKNNIRILYDGGAISNLTGDKWYYSARTSFGTLFEYTSNEYLYMGNFDNPYTPNLDLNWGEAEYFYGNYSYLTDNNLYNKYYKRYTSQIEDGKLLTANFALLETDISNLNLRDKNWVEDNYYNINVINDYDANSTDGETKVELISVDSGTKFTPQKTRLNQVPVSITKIVTGSASGNRSSNTSQYGNGSANNNDSGDFNVFQPGAQYNNVSGQGNNIAGNSQIVNGNGNNVQGNNNTVQGDGNTLL